MEINLVIKQMLPLASGVSKSGNSWSKQSYVGETLDQYPKQVFFSFFGNSIPQQPLTIGSIFTIKFDLESRSFVGKDGVERWSTDVKAYGVAPYKAAAPQPQQAAYPQPANYDAQAQQYFGGTPVPDDRDPF